jgi:glycosyltransferase involved in cell wall biosynthesis
MAPCAPRGLGLCPLSLWERVGVRGLRRLPTGPLGSHHAAPGPPHAAPAKSRACSAAEPRASARGNSRPDHPRILFVSHVGEMGGAEHSLLTLVRGLAAGPYEVHVALPAVGGPLSLELMRTPGVTQHPVPQLGPLRRRLLSWLRWFSGKRALRALVEELRPDIVHANTDIAMIFASGVRAEAGPRVIWHIRDMRRLGRLGALLTECCDARVAVSSAVAERYGLDLAGRDRVIPNGIDLARFASGEGRREVRAELGIPESAIVCLAIGQDVPWKRLDDFAALSGDGYHRVLVTYPAPGSGARDACRPRPGVHVLPYREDIERLFAAADVYVHPAEAEAFGRTVVEALAAGLPVIAADDAGPAEIVEHEVNGLLVPAHDVTALEAAVRRLVGDAELRRRLGAAARERAKAFSAEAHVAQVEGLYTELLLRRGATAHEDRD